MTRIMWACWDGGGNLTPSLGIARVLEARGHEIHFFGRPDMVGRVEAAGFGATVLTEARTDLDRYAFHPLATVFGFTSTPAADRGHAAHVFPSSRQQLAGSLRHAERVASTCRVRPAAGSRHALG